MRIEPVTLYFFCFASALVLALALTPAARALALRWKVLDEPDHAVKTHSAAVPYLGGAAVFIAFAIPLMGVRLLTHFPTGTLKSIRGILFGATLMWLVGLVDDARRGGLHFRTKFVLQAFAAAVLIFFDVHIRFADPPWLAAGLTLIWVIGVTNALNLTDIMDGLAGGLTAIASLAFLFISLPTEEIYVNFTAAALAGACLGFLPYNLSRRYRIFMGDSGSLVLGFALAALSMGTSYTRMNEIGLLSPLLILAVPIYDTLLVSILRIRKGRSPFLGSKDHFPLRLEALGLNRRQILVICYAASIAASGTAYLITRLPLWGALMTVGVAGLTVGLISLKIARVRV